LSSAATRKKGVAFSTILWIGLSLVAAVIISVIVWKVATRQPAEPSGDDPGPGARAADADETPESARIDAEGKGAQASVDPGVGDTTPPPTGNIEVKVSSDPTGAVVFVDGEKRGATPTVIKELAPDHPYRFRIEADGFHPWKQTYTFDRSNVHREVHAGLLSASNCEGGTGWIYVLSEPEGATIEIDGKRMPGKTPQLIDKVCAGKRHVVRVQAIGYRTWRKEVGVKRGKVLNLRAELEK
jgi:hypothetical protein